MQQAVIKIIPAGCLAIACFLAGTSRSVAAAAPASELRLTSPLDYQVTQRHTRTEGTIPLAGTLTPAPVEGVVEARIVGGAAPDVWRKVASVPAGQASFTAPFPVPAGGWYRLEVRVKRGDAAVAAGSVEHVGVGEIFVIAGQSNSANHGEEKQQTETRLVASFSGTAWKLADDPQPGASGSGGSFAPGFGDALTKRFNVPVGIVAAGVGATSVREWLPAGSTFPNPPTLTERVAPLPSGEWTSKGLLFDRLTARVKQLGKEGFRAVLWHQGESDANQQDPTRTLSGDLYRKYLAELIAQTRREAGWDIPWFVAQASYHSPDDRGSPEIRQAQQALWQSRLALEGPDTDLLAGAYRDSGGNGVHFSASGLREHAVRWMDKVAPWLEAKLEPVRANPVSNSPASPAIPGRIALPGENFVLKGRPAFLFLPPENKRANPQPWIFYAPTLPPFPDESERWMHEQFLAAGIAVAGIDVGEAYGNPASHLLFDALYQELTERRGFAGKPCLFGRSRGGLWVSSWAIANPARVSGLIGIYPVFDFRTYPGITNTAKAYGLSPVELTARAGELNPIERIAVLARARVPAALIHGEMDKVVPLPENSGEFVRRYEEAGAKGLVKLIVLEGQGHSYFEGYFHSPELVNFAIERASKFRMQNSEFRSLDPD